jgi:hypothetical protein
MDFDIMSFDAALELILNLKVESNINDYKIAENAEHIIRNVIKEKQRFGWNGRSTESFCISSYHNHRCFLNANIKEFPSCCGKAIFHGFKINNTIYTNTNPKQLTDDEYRAVFKALMTYIDSIIKFMGYGHYDMIISEKEQPNIFKAANELGYKPTYTFNNRRYPDENKTCHNYSLEVV